MQMAHSGKFNTVASTPLKGTDILRPSGRRTHIRSPIDFCTSTRVTRTPLYASFLSLARVSSIEFTKKKVCQAGKKWLMRPRPRCLPQDAPRDRHTLPRRRHIFKYWHTCCDRCLAQEPVLCIDSNMTLADVTFAHGLRGSINMLADVTRVLDALTRSVVHANADTSAQITQFTKSLSELYNTTSTSSPPIPRHSAWASKAWSSCASPISATPSPGG